MFESRNLKAIQAISNCEFSRMRNAPAHRRKLRSDLGFVFVPDRRMENGGPAFANPPISNFQSRPRWVF